MLLMNKTHRLSGAGAAFVKRPGHEDDSASLDSDLAVTERVVSRDVRVPLTQSQFDALVSFAQDVGVGAFSRSALVRRLNEGHYEAVPDEMRRWVHSRGHVSGELTARRQDEAALFQSGDYGAPSSHPPGKTHRAGRPAAPPPRPGDMAALAGKIAAKYIGATFLTSGAVAGVAGIAGRATQSTDRHRAIQKVVDAVSRTVQSSVSQTLTDPLRMMRDVAEMMTPLSLLSPSGEDMKAALGMMGELTQMMAPLSLLSPSRKDMKRSLGMMGDMAEMMTPLTILGRVAAEKSPPRRMVTDFAQMMVPLSSIGGLFQQGDAHRHDHLAAPGMMMGGVDLSKTLRIGAWMTQHDNDSRRMARDLERRGAHGFGSLDRTQIFLALETLSGPPLEAILSGDHSMIGMAAAAQLNVWLKNHNDITRAQAGPGMMGGADLSKTPRIGAWMTQHHDDLSRMARVLERRGVHGVGALSRDQLFMALESLPGPTLEAILSGDHSMIGMAAAAQLNVWLKNHNATAVHSPSDLIRQFRNAEFQVLSSALKTSLNMFTALSHVPGVGPAFGTAAAAMRVAHGAFLASGTFGAASLGSEASLALARGAAQGLMDFSIGKFVQRALGGREELEAIADVAGHLAKDGLAVVKAKVGKVRDVVNKDIDFVVRGVAGAAGFVGSLLNSQFSSVVGQIEKIPGLARTGIQVFKSLFETTDKLGLVRRVADRALADFGALRTGVSQTFHSLVDRAKALPERLFNNAGRLAHQVFDRGSALAHSVFDKGGSLAHGAFDFGSHIAHRAFDKAGTLAHNIFDKATGVAGRLGIDTTGAKTLAQAVGSTADRAFNTGGAMANEAFDKAGNVATNVFDTAGNVANNVFNFGSTVANRAFNNLGNNANKVFNKAGNVAGRVASLPGTAMQRVSQWGGMLPTLGYGAHMPPMFGSGIPSIGIPGLGMPSNPMINGIPASAVGAMGYSAHLPMGPPALPTMGTLARTMGALAGGPVGAVTQAAGSVAQSVGGMLGSALGLQFSGGGGHPDTDPSALLHGLKKQSSGFSPDSNLRGRLGGHLGFDPGGARLHTGPVAAQAARNLNAEAFTIGQDVFFGEGRFDPTSSKGLGLIAHELTHVGQQTGTTGDKARFFTGRGGDEMEKEAQQVGARVLANAGRSQGVSVGLYDRRYESDGEDSVSESDRQRLDMISLMALKEAENLLWQRGIKGRQNLDSLEVSVSLDLTRMSNQEAARSWAEAIVAAIPSSQQRSAQEQAPPPQPLTGEQRRVTPIVQRTPVQRSATSEVLQRQPTTQQTKPEIKFQIGWLTDEGIPVETNEQVAVVAWLTIASLQESLGDVDSDGVKTQVTEWIATVKGALPYFVRHAGEKVDPSLIPLINHQYDELLEVRAAVNQDKLIQIKEALWREHDAAVKAAEEAEALQPALDDAMRAAYRKGSSNTVKDVVSTAKGALSIGRSLRSLAAGITKDIMGLPLASGTKIFVDHWTSQIGTPKITIINVGKYTESLGKLGRGLSALNVVLTIADRSKKATEAEQGMKDLSDAVSISTDLVSASSWSAPPHFSLYSTLYLKPALKVISKQIGVLVENLSDVNRTAVEVTGDLMYPNAEPGGQEMFDVMVKVMHAEDESGFPALPSGVQEYLFDHREKLSTGAESDVPTEGSLFWKHLDGPAGRRWLFDKRQRVWAMFYGSMKIPAGGRPLARAALSGTPADVGSHEQAAQTVEEAIVSGMPAHVSPMDLHPSPLSIQRKPADKTEHLASPYFRGNAALEGIYHGQRAALHKNDTGKPVGRVQQALSDLGFREPKYGVDEVFGQETQDAVMALQNARGLDPDGKVGADTLREMEKTVNAPPTATPDIATTEPALGGQVTGDMDTANSVATADAGIYYQYNYRSAFPKKWKPDYISGYANPYYFERLNFMDWRLKPGCSASAGLKAWLKGLTIAECNSSLVAMEIDSLRAAIGDAKFDAKFGTPSQAIPKEQRLRIKTGTQDTPVEHYMVATEAAKKGDAGTEGNRPAKAGEWYYFYNHPKYLLKHPGGAWQGENALCMGIKDGKQVWSGLGASNVDEAGMFQEMIDDYNGGRTEDDYRALRGMFPGVDPIRHPEQLSPEYREGSGVFPDVIGVADILNEPPYTISGTTRKGGFLASSGQHLDVAAVQKTRDEP